MQGTSKKAKAAGKKAMVPLTATKDVWAVAMQSHDLPAAVDKLNEE